MGGVIGGVVKLVVFVVALFMCMRRKKAQAAAKDLQLTDSNLGHEMAANDMRRELESGDLIMSIERVGGHTISQCGEAFGGAIRRQLLTCTAETNRSFSNCGVLISNGE